MERSAATAVATGMADSRDTQQTHEIGRRIGAAAAPGAILALVGPLGAGKTVLTKGVAAGLGIDGVVNSPTFILMNEHVGRLRLYHIDAYRLADGEEAVAAGLLDERQADGVTVIEWADRLSGWLPVERLEIRLETPPGEPMRRVLRWTATDATHERLASETLAAP